MNKLLILGIGNLLMGDEGVGIHVVQHLQNNYHWKAVDIVDGGTGGFHLLEYFQSYPLVFLVDATIDNDLPGTVKLLKPKFSSDYPPTLSAHDIGLKDLLDALYLLNNQPEIWLFTISIARLASVSLELTPEVKAAISKASNVIASHVIKLKSLK